MIWMILGASLQDPGNYSFDYKLLDGDMEQVRLLDRTVDFGKWEIKPTVQWQSGRHVDPANVPTRVRMLYSRTGSPVSRGEVNLPDYIVTAGAQIVSGSFKEILQAYDPGQHQFLPVSLEWGNGEDVGRIYFWMAPGKRLFALDAEQTKPPMLEMPSGPDWISPDPERPAMRFDTVAPADTWQPVFLAHKVGDTGLFCDGEMSKFIFISDRLRRALEDAGMNGYRLRGPFQISAAF